MPQRSNNLQTPTPVGRTMFSSGWGSARERTNTLDSVRSDGSERHSLAEHKDSLTDIDVKTLDYLGLVDTPSQAVTQATLQQSIFEQRSAGMSQLPQPLLANLAALDKMANRFRSYSVNAKERYATGEEDPEYAAFQDSNRVPSAEAAAAALAATQAQIHQHNLEVQAYANQASSTRPRARTAGVLDSPSTRFWRNHVAYQAQLDGRVKVEDARPGDEYENTGLADAVQALQLHNHASRVSNRLELPDSGRQDDASRALWLGNIPSSITSISLKVLFEPFGKIESIRVLSHKTCGFVNFEHLESAVRARAQYDGKEIFPGAGPIKIGYARAPSGVGSPYTNGGASVSPNPDSQTQLHDERTTNDIVGQQHAVMLTADNPYRDIPVQPFSEIEVDISSIVVGLDADPAEQSRILTMLKSASASAITTRTVNALQTPEPVSTRMHDASRLREIRKRIDNNTCTSAEIESIAMTMLPELSELASDYLGNTVVQKLFEYCNEDVKDMMLRMMAPHLAEIGMHKNGTWAAQKVIDVTRTQSQMSIIVEHLAPHGVSLFLDQYGNYVMQCCLRFPAPLNNFIFEVMVKNLSEIAQGRFGARAMRACLESHHTTKDQQRMLAAAISLHGVRLATDSNGAILLTWLLDTCTFPRRRAILAPRMVPHLVLLCTHKVAYLIVLKIINQRMEPEARDVILQALFFSPDDKVLHDILLDQICGATLVFKILTTPFFDEKIRYDAVQNIRKVLADINAQSSQAYKRLMDEVGLSGSGKVSMTERVSPVNTQAIVQAPSMPALGGGPQQSTVVGGAGYSNMQGQPNGDYQSLAHRNGPVYPNVDTNSHSIPINMSMNMYSPKSNLALGTGPQYQHAMFGTQRGAGPHGYPNRAMHGYQGQPRGPYNPYQDRSRNDLMQQQMGLGPGSAPSSAGYNRHGSYPPIMANGDLSQMWFQYHGQYRTQPSQMHGQPMMGGGWQGRVSCNAHKSFKACRLTCCP